MPSYLDKSHATENSPSNPGVPLMDVGRQHRPIREKLLAAMAHVLDSGRYVLGPACDELEKNLAAYCGARHAVSCASGSDALLLALMVYDIGPGDEVICPSYTFFATASAVWRLGARPVFADIDPATFNLDPNGLAALITPRTKAIIPVHLYGQCAEMGPINAIAAEHGVPVIEDAAQAIGADIDGRRAGSLSQIGCVSFYPTKNLGCLGDGGLLTTDDGKTADKLRLLRGHGMEPRYYHQVVGINSRLDSLQAAILNVKLGSLDRWSVMRKTNAHRYRELFISHELESRLELPSEAPGRRHVWNQYVIRVRGGQRDALREHLAKHQIGAEIYYPVPLHRQACFASLGYAEGSLPESERAAAETLALPIFPELTADEQAQVVESIAEFFSARPAKRDDSTAVKAPKFQQRAGQPRTGIAG